MRAGLRESGAEGESRGRGFSPDGRPIILFEPHIFSKATLRKYDLSNPNVSYKTWGDKPYPGTQAGRYAQLEEAFGLDPEAAVGSASWGLFQILGQNYKACGFASATAFVTDMAQSEARMLAAFEAFVRANKILDELQNKDWAGFARVYNGPGQVDKYAKLLSDAYTRRAQGPNADTLKERGVVFFGFAQQNLSRPKKSMRRSYPPIPRPTRRWSIRWVCRNFWRASRRGIATL
ncbi:MAG: N-acetylmuramidase family protein [Alphaproteobacteria bacterium]